MVVAGLDACLDLLAPADADSWLANELKSAILSFQDEYSGEAALIFWMPKGERRFHTDMARDAVRWRCSALRHLFQHGQVGWFSFRGCEPSEPAARQSER